MLFDSSIGDFESEKERNLYYKIFAGYLFNELIPGYSDRLAEFCHMLDHPTSRGMAAPSQQVILNPDSTHVSFDNHLYLFEELKADRGEFADVFLHDSSNRTMVFIEAKLHSNWAYEKDIVANQRRHMQLKSLMPAVVIVPVLLVTRSRWEHAKAKESSDHSNYLQFHEDPDCAFRVLLWERIADVIREEKVRTFLESQLCRRDRGFSYVGAKDWFVQQPPKKTSA
jgi:hypothetical protein